MSIINIEKVKIWDYYNPIENRLEMIEIDNIPFIKYPNNLPCYEGNMYIMSLVKKNVSRKVRGGTLRTYAHQIIHLIKYCYNNNLEIYHLSNERFTMFIKGLIAEKDDKSQRIRTNNQVISIGTRCLEFLIFIQNLHDINNLIGEGNENSIKVIIKKSSKKIPGYKHLIERTSLYHASFPLKSPIKRKQPVSQNAAKMLFDYLNSEKNNLLRRRNLALYSCLDQLGARRFEVDLLKVDDILTAIKSPEEYPYIKVTTLKRRDDIFYRYVPVTRTFLSDIQNYIYYSRKKIIKNTIGAKNDHGYLFVALNTGQPLAADSITTLFNYWRKDCGINEELHPQLFRHAFITNKLIEIILSHKDIKTPDDFKRLILHTEEFKLILKEWTGHTRISSLDTYIHLAFREIYGIQKMIKTDKLNDSVKSAKNIIKRIKADITSNELSVSEIMLSLDVVLDALQDDINASVSQIRNIDFL